MSEGDTFDRILASLHEAALDDAYWPAASALIDDAVRAKGHSLVFGSGSPEQGIQIFSAGYFRGGQRHRELEREYFDTYYPVDERAPRLRNLPDSQLVHTADLYTDKELKTSPAYNEFLHLAHVQKGLNVRLDGPNGTRIVWVINDPIDADGWSSAQTELIRRLLPHMRQYVSVRQMLAGAGALGASFDELLSTRGSGIVQLDSRGRIIAANDRARDLLRTADGLFDEGGFLFARSSADDDDLQGLLTRALPSFGAEGTAGSMMVRRSAALSPLMLHITPVDSREREFRAWPVAALVLVVDAGRGTRIDAGLVAAVLGLTPMESRVVVLLAEGKTVREIASATGRRVSTIRWHVRQIFTKHGLTRQGDLVQLVLSVAGAPHARP